VERAKAWIAILEVERAATWSEESEGLGSETCDQLHDEPAVISKTEKVFSIDGWLG